VGSKIVSIDKYLDILLGHWKLIFQSKGILSGSLHKMILQFYIVIVARESYDNKGSVKSGAVPLNSLPFTRWHFNLKKRCTNGSPKIHAVPLVVQHVS